jgi:hypothetical protein
MFEPSLRQAQKALETIGVDDRTGRDILVEERDDGAALKIWDRFHADATCTPAAPFHCDQNQRCPSPLKLSASTEASLFAANPRFINLYLAVQWFPSHIHHRPAELVKQHPGGLVTGQAELPLEQQGRNSALVRGHQIGRPEPLGQPDLRPMKNCPGCQRDLVTAARTLPPPLIHQVISSPISAARTDETLGPAAGRQVPFAGFLGSEIALELPQGLGKWRPGHLSTLPIGVC